jgi:hypothetical protein
MLYQSKLWFVGGEYPRTTALVPCIIEQATLQALLDSDLKLLQMPHTLFSTLRAMHLSFACFMLFADCNSQLLLLLLLRDCRAKGGLVAWERSPTSPVLSRQRLLLHWPADDDSTS